MRIYKSSFQKRLLSIFIIGYLWIIAVLCLFSGYLYYQYDKNIHRTANEMLELYGMELEELLSLSENHLLNMVYNNSQAQSLKRSGTEMQKYNASYELQSMLKSQMSLQPGIAGFQFFYENGSHWYHTYREIVTPEDRLLLKQKALEQINEGHNHGTWQIVSGDERNYLILTSGEQGMYESIIIDFASIAVHAEIGDFNSEDIAVLYSDSEGILANQPVAEKMGISPHTYFANGESIGGRLYLNREIPYTELTILVSVSYFNFNVWITMLLIILAIIFITITAAMLSHSRIHRVFIVPLNYIYQTILSVSSGDIDKRISPDMEIAEYEQISKSFNEMMDQIEDLKIQAYEERIREERAKFQYLQLQIKPHFFLNCLKILYALSQQKKYGKLEQMIIEVSKYFRYIFRDNLDIVTLREELQFTGNYVSLQKNTSLVRLDFSCDIADELQERSTIPLVIQTFVENSVKYADAAGQLSIRVKVICLRGETGEYLDIIISDNGVGYSPEWVKKINQSDDIAAGGEHTGILNLKRRLQLKFGSESEIIVRNHYGAVSEIIYPVG